jgi:gliding motility-associated-like protein
MKIFTSLLRVFFILLLTVVAKHSNAQSVSCGSLVPSFTANLVGSPSGTWVSPAVVRDDTCCGATAPDKCIKITILLDQGAMGINFNITSGAVPPGALFYQIGCGPPQLVGTPICLNGAGPHFLTFCKPGNNNNIYEIVSVPAPVVPDSILIRSGCTQSLAVTGFSVPTINWVAVPNNTLHNTYLSCTSGCSSVIVAPTGTPPPFVDYEVSGFGQAPCQASFYRDTVRVYFYNDLVAGINPTLSTICFGNNTAPLTATVVGGIGPYTYSWSPNASASSTVLVGPGTYTVRVFDNTGCPPTTATAIVNSFTLPITANAGPAQTRCKLNPNVSLNGSVSIATGGIWSGGSGLFSPSPTVLNATYFPSPAEVSSGSVQLQLSTTGNSGCPPGTSNLNVFFQNQATVNAGPDQSLCFNNAAASFTAGISGFSATPLWSSTGTGNFSSNTASITSYTPSVADLNSGTISIVLSSANNGACPAVSDTLKLFITPLPLINAGTDFTMCSTNTLSLNGSISGSALNTGSWSTTGNGFFINQFSLNANYVPGSGDITAGTVTLILTSTFNGNCAPVRDSLRVSIQRQATITANNLSPVCSITPSILLSGNITGNTSTGAWSGNGSGNFINQNQPSASIYNLSNPDRLLSSLSFTLSSTNNGVCTAAQRVLTLSIVPQATLNAGPNQLVCDLTKTIALNGSNQAGGPIQWVSNGNGTLSSSGNLQTTYSMSPFDAIFGTVVFSLTSLNNSVCPVTLDTVAIKVSQQTTVNAGADVEICSSQAQITLNGSIAGETTSGLWSGNGSGTLNAQNPGSYQTSAADIQNGTVRFILNSTNNLVCPSVSDTLLLNIRNNPVLFVGNDSSFCYKEVPFYLDPSVQNGGSTYVWTSTGNGKFNPNNFSFPVYYEPGSSDVAAGQVLLTLNSVNNGACGNVSASIRLYLKPSPKALFTLSGSTLTLPNNTVQTNNQSTSAGSFTWTFGNGSTSYSANPLITYNEVGNYPITLIAENEYKCSDTTTQIVLVISDVVFPNAFTPNTNGSNGGTYNTGDLTNDVFYPFTGGVTEYQLMIFNRWGEQIFMSTDIKIGWDGYFNGKPCQQDVYVWKANMTFFDGRTYSKAGTVTLLR